MRQAAGRYVIQACSGCFMTFKQQPVESSMHPPIMPITHALSAAWLAVASIRQVMRQTGAAVL
jgi:hypothetical protein